MQPSRTRPARLPRARPCAAACWSHARRIGAVVRANLLEQPARACPARGAATHLGRGVGRRKSSRMPFSVAVGGGAQPSARGRARCQPSRARSTRRSVARHARPGGQASQHRRGHGGRRGRRWWSERRTSARRRVNISTLVACEALGRRHELRCWRRLRASAPASSDTWVASGRARRQIGDRTPMISAGGARL